MTIKEERLEKIAEAQKNGTVHLSKKIDDIVNENEEHFVKLNDCYPPINFPIKSCKLFSFCWSFNFVFSLF